jgi:exodeoxyribonuclease VII small subunit
MKPISELGYEEARDELIEVVRQLEQGGLDLDASLKLWERGEELARRCDEHLAGARKRIEDALAAARTKKLTLETVLALGSKLNTFHLCSRAWVMQP